jgi:hypothetical protein
MYFYHQRESPYYATMYGAPAFAEHIAAAFPEAE